MFYQVLFFSFLFSLPLYSDTFSMNKIFHENGFQKAQKQSIKIGDLFYEWFRLKDDEKAIYRIGFVKAICSLSFDNYFYTRLFIDSENTKKEDLVYLLKLQNQISNHLNNIPVYDDCLISSKHLLGESINLIYNKIN